MRKLVSLLYVLALFACSDSAQIEEELEGRERAVLGNIKLPEKGTPNSDPGPLETKEEREDDIPARNDDQTVTVLLPQFVKHMPAADVGNENQLVIRVAESFPGGTWHLYADSACSESIATSDSSQSDIHIELQNDGDYTFYLQFETANGDFSACSDEGESYTLDRVISPISDISLVDPASGVGSTRTPTVRVAGLEVGSSVSLFNHENCLVSRQLGFGVAEDSQIDIVLGAATLATDGSYQIHAVTTDRAGNQTPCSAISANYMLDTTAPTAPTDLTLSGTASPGADISPSLLVEGLEIGAELLVYADDTCENELDRFTVTSGSETFTLSDLANDGSYRFHAVLIDTAGNSSSCSSNGANYVLDNSPPSLTSVSIGAAGGQSLAGAGGQAILSFTASEPLPDVAVLIHGEEATVTHLSGLNYQAVYEFVSGDTSTSQVSFSIDFADSVGRSGTTVTEVTDDSFLEFDASNVSPSLTLTNQSVVENNLLSYDINDDTGSDVDDGGEALTYSCYYDESLDLSVARNSSCSNLGASFNSATGFLTWTPGYSAAGVYEVKVIADDGNFTAEDIFVLTVLNNNRLATIAPVNNATLNEADQLQYDFDDSQTNSDVDIDGEAITWSCHYDDLIDGSVSAANTCSSITGLNFSESSGQFSWTTVPSNVGFYEVKISANDGIGSSAIFFEVEVAIDISRQKQIAMVGSDTTSYFSSLGANNQVYLNGALVDTYGLGEIFSFATTAGDVLECEAGCFAITPIDGTAAWSTQTYAGTLLSTYMGRYDEAKLIISAFDQDAYVEIKQPSGLVASGNVSANSIMEFQFNYTVGSLWIESNQEVSAYISTRNASGVFQYDGRVITAAAKESLAFVSGGGGTPSGITTITDGAIVSAYRNDGQNFINETINVVDVLDVTSSAKQNPASSAIAIYADRNVVSTQHADGDGINATPSLPKSMLSTHYAIPMEGDYVSFASYQPGTVQVLDVTDTIIETLDLTRGSSANVLAPYAATYNKNSIPAGTRFVCSVNCLGVFEPKTNDDETIMIGTIKDGLSLSSSVLTSGQSYPNSFSGASCSGNGDFPELSFSSVPWGTKSFAVIVDKVGIADSNHLNLLDILGSSIPAAMTSAGSISFSDGTSGMNDYSVNGWSPPCLQSGESLRFTVFALSQTIGSAVGALSAEEFSSLYSSSILAQSSLIFNN